MEQHTSGEKAAPVVKASDIMPDLPDSSAPALSAEDRLVVLLASAAQAGGRLTPEAWKKASEALSSVFSPDLDVMVSGAARKEAEHEFFVLQTRFHAALLREPLSPVQFEADRHLAGDLASLSPDRAAEYEAALRELAPAYAEVVHRAVPGDGVQRRRMPEGWLRSFRNLPGVSEWESLFHAEDEREEEDARGIVMEGGVAQPRPKKKELMPHALRRQMEFVASMLTEAGAVCNDIADSAASQYGDAARYLRDVRVRRMFSLFSRNGGEGSVASSFRQAAETVGELEEAVMEAGSFELARSLDDFRHLLFEQPFTLVIVGEGKRGKSSLVNALLAGRFSPVRETVPETAAVARFRWGKAFRGRVRFLSREECGAMELLPRTEEDGFLDRLEKFRRVAPPLSDRELSSEEELREFLSAGERGSLFSARVDVEVPSEILKHGLTLVDTPGLNAMDPVQNYLAYEECLGADCLIFVMDARRPESASEQELLRQLARSGRAAAVIGIVTGADRLNEKESRKDALVRAQLLMDTAVSCGMKVLGLLEINAREAMEQRCSVPRRSGGREFQELCRLIERAASEAGRGDGIDQRIMARGRELAEEVRREAVLFRQREKDRLPDPQHEAILRSHVENLESVIRSCSSQAWSIVSAASVDMEAWRKEQDRALDSWQERIVLRIMDAANRHADTLGYTGMFRPKNWKRFDEEEVPRMARASLEELLADRRDVQKDWNEKLRHFGERMQELSVLCLDAVTAGELDLNSISEIPFSRERWLVNASSLMKKLGLVAVGLAVRRGGGIGLGIILGNMGWWAVLPVTMAGSLIWTLMKLGSPARCRRIFMERKEEAVRRWVEEKRRRLDDLLNQNLEDLTSAYGKAVSEGFVPSLAILAEEASALRTYLGVLEKIRAGTEQQAQKNVRLAEALEKELALIKPLS